MMTRPFFKRLIKACALVVALSIAVDGVAKAESPYPRTQVENHLRAMFPDLHLDRIPDFIPKELFNVGLSGFEYLGQKPEVRFSFVNLKDDEKDDARSIVRDLSEILDVPFVGIDPYNQEFDLLVLVWDNLPFSATISSARRLLQADNSDEAYLRTLREYETQAGVYPTTRLERDARDRLVVIATERYTGELAEQNPIGAQLRYVVFAALTGAVFSDVITPSVVNSPLSPKKPNGFAPIDRAVLHTIFAHDDWSGLAYEPKIKLLTDRVMEQLKGMSSSMFFDRHFAHDGPGSMT
ncbi:hypothetical protein [Magnetovibrio sp.]|uniref:hypothetical protein n=1 Tax=Magnetovibrio sp. TaxID=2024836 RepID=UPI002F95CDBC